MIARTQALVVDIVAKPLRSLLIGMLPLSKKYTAVFPGKDLFLSLLQRTFVVHR